VQVHFSDHEGAKMKNATLTVNEHDEVMISFYGLLSTGYSW